ncbi:MAG TPA: hypothetical protein PKB10_03530 [Tepidisphaeraceae bacterium]|nr:hypothetical protein [Tepidisphaeraceae bacterium]
MGKYLEILREVTLLPASVRTLPRVWTLTTTLLRYYQHQRKLNLDLIQLPSGELTTGRLFAHLWTWREVYTTHHLDFVYSSIYDLHIEMTGRTNQLMRSEFAFLTAWIGSVGWASSHITKFSHLPNFRTEIDELLLQSKSYAIRALLGRGNQVTQWERMDEKTGNDWVITNVGLSASQYTSWIEPIEARLADELRQFRLLLEGGIEKGHY